MTPRLSSASRKKSGGGEPLIWSTACPDWERRIAQRESLIPFAPLFPKEAKAALDVFKVLRCVDVAGTPTMGEICRPWILEFVAAIFGSYDEDAGRRLVNTFFELVSKKNSKSTTAAGIMMTALVRNWRPSAEFLILAPTIEIADNSFRPARDMVAEDEELSALMHVQEHYRTITHRQTKATLKVVAADKETVGGKKATGVLIDELWQFGAKANAENMLTEATGGLLSRPEGFVIYLSTQSEEAPAGVFKQKLQYARDVRDGKIDDRKFLPVLYEFPRAIVKAKRYLDPKLFFMTNPNLGASVDEETILQKFKEAEIGGETSLCGFAAKHLNIEIGLALGSNSWPGAEFWEQCGEQGLTLDRLLSRCEVVCIGIDGGGLDDLLGLAVVGRERDTGRWLHWGHAWAHKIVLERRKEIASALQDFAAAGDLTIVDLPGQDVSEVADIICNIRDQGLLPDRNAIGVDAAGIADILDELESAERGFAPEQNGGEKKIVAISQGWRLNGTIKTTERKLAGGQVIHCARPLMAWSVGNAKVVPSGNAVSITKQASGSAKIDPLMALFDATYLLALNPQAAGQKYQVLFL